MNSIEQAIKNEFNMIWTYQQFDVYMPMLLNAFNKWQQSQQPEIPEEKIFSNIINTQAEEIHQLKERIAGYAHNLEKIKCAGCGDTNRHNEAYCMNPKCSIYAKEPQSQQPQEDDLFDAVRDYRKNHQSQQPEWEKKFAELRASHIMEVQGFLELNRKLGDEIAAINQKGNGSDAVAFKDWCDSGKAWFFDVQEDHTHTTEELYKLYKQSKL